MKFQMALAGLLVLAAACAPAIQQAPPTQSDASVWLLASPVTKDFPAGALSTPESHWTKIARYSNFAQCNSSADQMRNETGRVVDCVASDNPALRAND